MFYISERASQLHCKFYFYRHTPQVNQIYIPLFLWVVAGTITFYYLNITGKVDQSLKEQLVYSHPLSFIVELEFDHDPPSSTYRVPHIVLVHSFHTPLCIISIHRVIGNL